MTRAPESSRSSIPRAGSFDSTVGLIREWNGSAFNFIPQGAGDHDVTHRCAGEWITIELLKTAVRLLTTGTRYTVPEQDLSIDLGRIPAAPVSGFVIREMKKA